MRATSQVVQHNLWLEGFCALIGSRNPASAGTVIPSSFVRVCDMRIPVSKELIVKVAYLYSLLRARIVLYSVVIFV